MGIILFIMFYVDGDTESEKAQSLLAIKVKEPGFEPGNHGPNVHTPNHCAIGFPTILLLYTLLN